MPGILIAASDAATRHTLMAICEQNNFTAVEASTGQDCIQIIRTNTPDLVVMSFDLDRPPSYATYSRIQAITAVPVILLAAYSDVEKALKVGATDVVEWPAHPQLLVHRIRFCLQLQTTKRGVQTVAAVDRTEGAQNELHLLIEALRNTAAILNSSLEFETVLDHLLVSIEQVIPNDMSTIILIDPDSREGYGVRTLDNTGRGLDQSLKNLRLPISEMKHLREMVETGDSLLITDTAEFETWVETAPTDWVRSVVSAPIQVEDDVIGFIFVNSARRNAFSRADSDILRVFANQAGIAIRNARLYEATQGYARTLETRVADRTAELEQERTQLQAILDSIGDGVHGLIYDDTHHRVYSFINPALHELIGYNLDDLNAMLDTDIVGNDPHDYTVLRAKLEDRVKELGLWKGEACIRSKEGALVDTGVTVTRLNRADGRMMGVVTIFRDMRQEKQLDAQKKRFVASAAHELRNPIGALKARLYLLQKQPERLEYHASVMERINIQLENLVEELLDLSRFENGLIKLRSGVIELVSFVRESVLMLEAEAEERGVWLIDRLAEPPLYVSIDETRMLQVMSNLLANAIKYTPEDGAVTIGIRKGDSGGPEEGYALLSIDDSGSGIEAEFLPHIFEPFYRVRDGGRGMGLGLAIIKEIVELHGGQITVTSTVGKGTCFTVWLKLVDVPYNSNG